MFICHAGAQKDTVAVWLRNQLRICGRRAFVDERDLRYGDDAPLVMETALRTASVVVAIITQQSVRSEFCLQELVWAFDQRARQRRQGQRPLSIFPIFYRHLDTSIGFGPGACQDTAAVRQRLRTDHPDASDAEREPWLQALQMVSKLTGIRQDSVGRCPALPCVHHVSRHNVAAVGCTFQADGYGLLCGVPPGLHAQYEAGL